MSSGGAAAASADVGAAAALHEPPPLARQRSKIIDKQMKKLAKEYKKQIRLLLLGCARPLPHRSPDSPPPRPSPSVLPISPSHLPFPTVTVQCDRLLVISSGHVLVRCNKASCCNPTQHALSMLHKMLHMHTCVATDSLNMQEEGVSVT